MKKQLAFLFIQVLLISFVQAQQKFDKQTFEYAVKDTLHLKLDKYVDTTLKTKDPRPVFVYVHGGGFATGSRVNALQIQYGKHFASQGFVVISIDYRHGLANNNQPDQKTILNAVNMATTDLIDATAFIIKNAAKWNIDTGKIIISGGSAGAITCLTAAYMIGSEDPSIRKKLPAGFNYAAVISHAGAVVANTDSLRWKRTPSPMLLMHGSADQLVSYKGFSLEGNLYAGSHYLDRQLDQLNIPHWLYEENGADHIVALKPMQHNLGEIDIFIDKIIMKKYQSSVHTIWKDQKPDSMQDMMKVVPLYIMGWDKTDEEVNQ